jgi:dTDP-4-dehydrorhamnose reductase
VILVFGGHGQLGQELSRSAGDRGIAVRTLSRADADIARPDQVAAALGRHRPGVVINAAAYSAVDRAEDDYEAAQRANCDGAATIAAACAAADIPLVHISTDYVFDGCKSGAYLETDAVAPLSVYGRTKAAGEAAVRAAAPKHLIVRTGWLYGAFGKNFLRTILQLAQEREELRIISDQYGTPTSAHELASALLSIAPRLLRNEPLWGTYHFSGTGIASRYDFAQWIVDIQARHTHRRPRLVPIATQDYPTRATRPANSALDSTRFRQVFGITADHWRSASERVIDTLLRP